MSEDCLIARREKIDFHKNRDNFPLKPKRNIFSVGKVAHLVSCSTDFFNCKNLFIFIMVENPKRRRYKDNPYKLLIENNKYFVFIKDKK